MYHQPETPWRARLMQDRATYSVLETLGFCRRKTDGLIPLLPDHILYSLELYHTAQKKSDLLFRAIAQPLRSLSPRL